MDRVAVFVDAGYLFAQGSTLLSGKKRPRGEINLDHEKVAAELRQFAERVSDLKLLRVYWYDGTSSGPTPQHIALAFTPRVKVRLGFVNSSGQQKGVDSLIVTDMLLLARNGAMAEAVLISGDEDLRVGVQQAQEYGAVVHLVGIKPARGSQSVALMQEADLTYEWCETDLMPFLSCSPRFEGPTSSGEAETPSETPGNALAASTPASSMQAAEPQPATSPDALEHVAQLAHTDTDAVIEGVASDVASEILDTELEPLIREIRGTGQIPKAVDGKLLARCRASLKTDLDSRQKKTVRSRFLSACEQRLGALAATTALS